MQEYDLELEEGLGSDAYEHLMQRWNLLQYKLDEVSSAYLDLLSGLLIMYYKQARMFLGLGNYNSSLSFLLSTHHEVKHIAMILSSSAKTIESHLLCRDHVRLPSCPTMIQLLSIILLPFSLTTVMRLCGFSEWPWARWRYSWRQWLWVSFVSEASLLVFSAVGTKVTYPDFESRRAGRQLGASSSRFLDAVELTFLSSCW